MFSTTPSPFPPPPAYPSSLFGPTQNFGASCGLYYLVANPSVRYNPFASTQARLFLPQAQLQVHATILQTTSRVTLTQTFLNPSPTKAIRQAKYVFPLYEGVSVVGFTCRVADRTIVGEVKKKDEATQEYTAAVQRGETAGLFEQLDAADTFMTTIGNVPPGAQVVVELTYLGELKHDMEIDGIRFTIPSIIAPRYGRTAPGTEAALAQYRLHMLPLAQSANISITVDMEMTEGSFIQKVLSPSHPISVSMGTTSVAPNDDPATSKASVTLGIQCTHFDTDFVLQIVAKQTGAPKAILETHPTIPNHRALMATLVPKFALPSQNPEIVFVCDRSGSMEGTSITLVIQALRIFLKSLPVGAMFNICSFGARGFGHNIGFTFLWPRSVAYSQQTLNEAMAHVGTFTANYGGTDMLPPVRATIEQRYKDIPLEVMLLTDGEIAEQDRMFTYLNEQVQAARTPIRVYTLGIGSGVSHALVEGIARAGNGFCQTVGQGEKMDSKVVRMLKGALTPHIDDYTLEVKYAGGRDTLNEEDSFEIVERVADSLKVKLDLDKEEDIEPRKPISLFDPSADPDNIPQSTHSAGPPAIDTPKIIQAPQRIPSLFAFIRTTVYLLLGPDAPRQTPQSVILRGTSAHGPLELEFPVQVLDKPGTTIHQLAAKKATYELEQGRGWLSEAKDRSGKLLKERHESRFDSMVEREAVRLGVQFQVSGKWCSFVATEKERKDDDGKGTEKWEYLEDELASESVPNARTSFPHFSDPYGNRLKGPIPFGSTNLPNSAMPLSSAVYIPGGESFGPGVGIPPNSTPHPAMSNQLFGSNSKPGGLFGQASQPAGSNQGPSLFGGTANTQALQPQATGFYMQNSQPSAGQSGLSSDPFASNNVAGAGGGLIQNFSAQTQPSGGGLFGGVSGQNQSSGGGLFGQPSQPSGDQGSSLFGRPAVTNQAASSLFGQPSQSPGDSGATTTGGGLFGQSQPASGGGLFGNSQPKSNNQSRGSFQLSSLTTSSSGATTTGGGLFGNSQPAYGGVPVESQPPRNTQSGGLFGNTRGSSPPLPPPAPSNFQPEEEAEDLAPPKNNDEAMALLISLQNFEGAWEYSASLFLVLKIGEAEVESTRLLAAAGGEKGQVGEKEWATALAIMYLETNLASLRNSWELVVDKARGWLAGSVGGKVDEVLGEARAILKA